VAKTLHTTSFNYIVKVRHVGGEVLIQRTMFEVPHRQDVLLIGKEKYVIASVMWNFNDARTVTLIVRNY
jgi:hypothetical protein